MGRTTAQEMAKQAGVDARVFRQALNEENFPWHVYYERWTVEVGSEQHQAMQRVLRRHSTWDTASRAVER